MFEINALESDGERSGWMTTDNFATTAFDVCVRVLISNHQGREKTEEKSREHAVLMDV
jgi:hypothetical protein